jgi:hypothetical protein
MFNPTDDVTEPAKLDGRLGLVADCFEAWGQIGRSMQSSDWGVPTRLAPLSTKDLYAHASWNAQLPEPPWHVVGDSPVAPTAIGVMRYLHQPRGAASAFGDFVVAAAQMDATATSADDLIERFAVEGSNTIASLRQLGDAVIERNPDPSGGSVLVRVPDHVTTIVIELVVHLYDLQHALGVSRSAPAAAERHVATVLAGIPSASEFIELAAGRTDASPFPVLR